MAPHWFITLSMWINKITPIHFMLCATAYAGFLYFLDYWHASLVFFFTMVCMLGVVAVLKVTLRVERPKDALIPMEHTHRAFPSGHVASAAFVGTMVPYTFPYATSTSAMLGLGSAIMALVVVVALSRLTLRVHTPVQVVAGFVIGVLVPILAIVVIDPPLTEFVLNLL